MERKKLSLPQENLYFIVLYRPDDKLGNKSPVIMDTLIPNEIIAFVMIRFIGNDKTN